MATDDGVGPGTTGGGPDDPGGPGTPVTLVHNKVRLALHLLRPTRLATAADGSGTLLVLHGLGEHSPDDVPADLTGWPGAVWGLDFTGHGRSTVPKGGGYTCELLVADADLALAHLGPVTVCGRGLGGYVAVLLAGARPQLVRGTIVCDGPGLAGRPTSVPAASAPLDTDVPPRDGDGDTTAPDRYALHELGGDVRSGDYAAGYAREAVRASGLRPAIVVCARARPDWLAAVLEVDGVDATTDVAESLRRFG